MTHATFNLSYYATSGELYEAYACGFTLSCLRTENNNGICN